MPSRSPEAPAPVRRSMQLTPELVARVARAVEDTGPSAGTVMHTESDYDASLQAFLQAGRWAHEDVWLFAYGSLLWNPACEVVEQVPALVPGWHRSFCLRLVRFRGTLEQPGLMMALDRGGSCRGMLCRVPGEQAVARLGLLWRREMSVKPPTNVPRWIIARSARGPVRAVAFTVDRHGRNYVGGLTLAQVADVLCHAAGHWGSGAEYLMKTVEHLEGVGIHDTGLWRLQSLVAERIAQLYRHSSTGEGAASRNGSGS
jgi:cation transport protein ChaC